MIAKRPLILIVDDEPEDIANYKSYLTRNSDRRLRVQEATTGAIALEICRRRTPDCVLIDSRLPDLNGLEFLRALASQSGRSGVLPCAVVMLAEIGDTQLVVNAMKYGAHDFLEKSWITPELLERTISNAIEKAALQREVEESQRELAIKNLMLEQRLADLEREVNERKQIQESLAGSERRFERLIEALPGVVWMSDATGAVTYKNDRWSDLTGLTIEEGLGDKWTATVHPDDLPRILAEWKKSVATGEPHEAPHRYRRRDGEYRWHLCRAVPLRDESGEIREWVGVSLDIHDRYLAERALIESEARYRALVEASSQLVWTADANGISDFSWQWWSVVTGLPVERLTSGRWIETVHSEDRQALRNVWRQSREAQAPFEIEFRLRASDGEYRHFSAHGVPLFTGDRFNGWIGMLDDVTDRRRAEVEVKLANDRFTVAEAAANGYVYDRNPASNRVQRSAGFGAVLGYDENEIAESHDWWKTLIHPDDVHRVKEMLNHVVSSRKTNGIGDGMAGGIANGFANGFADGFTNRFADGFAYGYDGYSLEYRIRHKDGRYLWVWDRGKLMRDNSDRVTRVIGTVVDITRRKQIENSMRESESRLKLAIAAMHGGAWEWDLVTNQVRWSDEMYQLFDRSPDEFTPTVEGWLGTLCAEDRKRAEEAMEAVRRGDDARMEYYLKGPDGAVRWLELRGISLRDELGCPVLVVGITTDITERKRADEALRESEEKFSKVFMASPHRIAITTLDEGRYIDVNDALLSHTGYERAEMIGRAGNELKIFDEPEGRQKLVQALQNGPVRNLEVQLRSKSGESRTVLMSAEIIMLGGRECILAVSNDITERVRAEDALRESEEKFSKVFKASPHRIAVSTLDEGRYIDVNDAVLSSLGYERAEMIGHTSNELGIFAELDVRQKLVKALQNGPVRNVELQLRSKSGEIRTVLWSGEIITLNGQRCLLNISNDITERKRAEEALRESEEKFSKVFKASPHRITITTLEEGRYIDVNEAVVRGTGYERSEVIGRAAKELNIFPEEGRRKLGLALRKGSVRDLEVGLQSKSGEVRTVLMSAEIVTLNGQRCVLTLSNDITERKRAEEALRESEERFRTLANTIPSIIWMAAADGTIIFHNQQWLDYCGVAPGENSDWTQHVIHHGDLERLIAEWTRAGALGREFEIELRIRRRDDQFRWFLVRATPSLQAEDRVARWFGVATDIHDRRQIEEALRDSQERLNLAMEAAGMFAWETDLTSGRVFWTDSGEQLMGMAPGSFGGTYEAFLALVHPDDRESVTSARKRALSGEAPYDVEFRKARPDGGVQWGHSKGVVHHDEHGRPARLVGVNVDITKRRQIEEALKLSEERYRLLVRASSNVVIITNASGGNPDSGSGWWEQLTGQSWEEARNQGWMKYVLPEDYDGTAATWRKAIADQKPFESDFRVRTRAGDYRWLHATGAPIRDASGEFREWAVALRDITERKRAEEAMHRANRRYLIALDAFDGYIYEYNIRDNVSERSKGLAKLIGFEPEDATPQLEWWINLIHHDDRDRFISEVAKTMSEDNAANSETNYSLEYRMRHKEGYYVDVLDRYQVARDAEGRPTQVVGAAINITDRKRTEEAQRESSEHLRMAMEAANAGSFDFDIVSGVITWTPNRSGPPGRADKIEEEYQAWRARVHPEDIGWVEADIAKALSERRDLYIEYRILKSDGGVEWVTNIGHTSYNEAGQPVRMRGLMIDATDRKRVEERLRESEERLRLALEGAQAGVWEVKFNPYRAYWSKEYRELYNFSEADQATNEMWATRVHPDDLQRVVDGNNGLLNAEQNEMRQEFRINHPEHGERWLLDFVRVRRDPSGRPISLGGINLDVTERKHAEIALRQSEERFRELVENISDVFWITDPKSRDPIYISPAYERLWGRPAATTFEEWVAAIHLEDRERVKMRYLAKIMEGGYDETYRVVRPDGSMVWVQDRGFPVYDDAGEIRHIVGVAEDITDRKRFEDALRESQRRYAALAEAVPQLVWTAGPDGSVDYFNQRWYGYTGATPDESMDQEWRTFIHPDDCEHVEKVWKRGLRMGEPVHFELRLRGADEAYHWFIGRGVPYRDERRGAAPRRQSGKNGAAGNGATFNEEKGRVIKWFGTFTDIHDLKMAEAVVRESEARLRLAAQAAGFGLYSADLQTGESYWSPELRRIFGLSNEAPVPMDKLIEFIHPDDREETRRVAEAALDPRGDGEFEVEFRAMRPDGSLRWALARGKTLFTNKGRRRQAARVIGVAFDITTRVEAEERLHASEELFRTIFDMSGIGILQIDPSTGRFLRANHEFCDWLGYTEAELLEMRIEDIAYPDDRNEEGAAIGRFLRVEMDEYSTETRCMRKDGGLVWGWITSRMLRDASGAPLRTVTTVQDITERKQFEEALMASERRYRNLIETANEGIWLVDTEATTIYVNERMASMLGYRADEIIGRKGLEFCFEHDAPKAVDLFYGCLIGNSQEFDFRFPCKDGGELLVLASTSPVYDTHGEIIGAMGMFTDITERKRAEEALRESERRLKLSLAAGRAGTWEWRIKEDKLIWSDEYYDLYGIKPGEMEPTLENFLFCVHLDDRDRMLIEMSEVLQERKDAEHEFRFIRPDGAVRWAHSSAQLTLDEMGEPERLIGIMIDITDRKQAEMEREELLRKEREARAQAESASRGKDEFVAMVSHELRSPLNAMLGWSKILKKGGVDAKTQTHAVEVIERSARAQQTLIEDLLDMARIVGGKLRLEMRPVNLARVVEAAADVVRPAAAIREITLDLTIKSADEVTGDPDRLQQVIWNLLSNAVKFTTHSGKVEVILERVGPSAQITVNDTGRGIKAEDLPFIFDRFRQADSSSTRRFTGLGLGLALVKHLVELHGGQVSAESLGEGQGASFIVRLPVRAVRGEASPVRVSDRDSVRTDEIDGRTALREAWDVYPIFPLEGVWAMIVDDEADARELVATLLKQYGARVSVASCAAEAFDKLRKGEAGGRPDVIVSDISMPDEDGYMLIERIRKLPPEEGGRIPAIALTALERPSDRIKALASGFSMHVPKPVEPEELAMVIANLTGQPGKRAPLR
ncbi:MAG TPA: PAS domain S-box protein [Blastocatellia bacterium]|nr:PAS domain S-box protein [Blastocatellia bacterium]